MGSTNCQSAIKRLNEAIDQVNRAFPDQVWSKVGGDGPDSITLHADGGFEGLTLAPGQTLAYKCNLTVSSSLVGVDVLGDTLTACFFSLYPTDIRHDGRSIFADKSIPCAAGPALFAVVDALKDGDNGVLDMVMTLADNQTTPWHRMTLISSRMLARREVYEIACARLMLAEKVAITPEDKALVEKAAAAVPETLIASDFAPVQQALESIGDILMPLAQRIADIKIHLIGHSHIDMNWMWTWPDTVETIKRDIKSVLSLMRDYPELTFSHSQPATYEVIREEEPAMFAECLKRIEEGRWEPITMTWVEGDVNMCAGEAMAQHLKIAMDYSRDVLNYTPTVFHCPDTFGHAGNLPQLAKSAGAIAYYHHRCNPGGFDQWPMFRWQGDDGSELLGISTPSYNGEITPRDIAAATIRAIDKGHPFAMHFHGIGDHGGGPSRQNMETLRRLQKTSGFPTAQCSTMSAYVNDMVNAGVPLPRSVGESSTIFEGCYTTHADTKVYNRHGENLLITADALSAAAGADQRPEAMDAWKNVLFNQFHDIFDGSAIHETYINNATDFAAVVTSVDGMNAKSLDILESGVPMGHIAVTNPLGWARTDCVLCPDLKGTGAAKLIAQDGSETAGQYTADGLVFVAQTPAFGTVAYRVENAEIPAHAGFPAVGDPDGLYVTIDTPLYTAQVRTNCGVIVSFVDKRVGKELVKFGKIRPSDYINEARPDLALNVFQVLDEYPHGMNSWQVQEIHSEISLIKGAKVKVVESGPVRCVLQVEHEIRESKITQRIVFYKDLMRIDFENDIDWQEIGDGEKGVPNLKAAFTASLLDCEAWFETPYSAARRPADGQETPALRWMDMGGADYGVAVLNDSKYGCDILGNRLRLTLLRSASEPDAISDKGQHTIRYAFFPHVGSWKDAGVVNEAAGFNQPLIARAHNIEHTVVASCFRPYLTGARNVLISGLRKAAFGDGVIVRAYDSVGRGGAVALNGVPTGAKVYETNVLEEIVREVEPTNLAFTAWQVRTLLIAEKAL